MCLTPHVDSIESSLPELNLDSKELVDNCEYIDWDNLNSFTQTLDGKIKVVQLNIRGIKGKYHDLIELIHKLDYPDIIILGETLLKQNDSQPLINGYKFLGHHRRNRKGGCVGFLVKFRELPEL